MKKRDSWNVKVKMLFLHIQSLIKLKYIDDL